MPPRLSKLLARALRAAVVEDELAEKIVNIRPKAMDHLRELRRSQGVEGDIYLRMGVRSGGCSGLSYVMDLVKEEEVTEDDMIEEYDGFKCVIDPKSVLYLYGLELDYSDALIGGGFQFQNPNAESSCGCVDLYQPQKMMEPQYKEVMWVRHQKDKGYWWPGVFVAVPDESSVLFSALRVKESFLIPRLGANCPEIKVPLFFLPSNGTLVAATSYTPYGKPPPCPEGTATPFKDKDKAQMDAMLATSRAVRENMSALEAPATPSTAVEEGKPFIEKSAMVPGLPLSSWSASSVGNTSQESPASSTSHADTEIDIPATQMERTIFQDKCSNETAHRFFRDASIRKDVEVESTEAGRETGRRALDSCSFEQRGKRQRSLIPDERSPGYDNERTSFSAPDSRRREGGFRCSSHKELSNSQRRKTSIEESHLPRLKSLSTQGTGGIKEHSGASKLFVRSGKAHVRHHEAVSLDTALSPNGVTLKTPQYPSYPGSNEASNGTAPILDARESEAQKMREVGITGREEFKKMMSKLGKIGWRHTKSLVTRLGASTWIVKPGLKIAQAQPGVEKFETPDAVVMYVQNVLRLDTTGTFESLGEKTDERTHQRSDAYEQVLGDDMEVCQDNTLPTRDLTKDEVAAVESEHCMKESAVYQTLQSALESLQPSNAPAVLKQRTEEYHEVFNFVFKSVRWSCGGSLYLCGCPGTGKTQTMTHVQKEVERRAAKEKFPKPEFHAFRGTAFTEPASMHNDLWHALAGDAKLPSDVEKALSSRLTYSKKPTMRSPMIVVVVDEIDQLMSNNRDVLRKLFEWADASKSRLVLVGIANSMEFDVGFSGLKTPPAKVLFPAYSPSNLVDILKERVGNTVAKGAIELCSRKVAATHGDARRAINICREAVVLAMRDVSDKLEVLSDEEKAQHGAAAGVVNIGHMSKALAGARVSRYKDAIAALSVQAQIILCVATAAFSNHSKSQEGQSVGTRPEKCARLTQGGLQDKCSSVWSKLRTGEGPSQVDFSGTIDMLDAQGLMRLKCNRSTHGRARQLELPIEMSDVEAALGTQPFYTTATKI